MQHEAFARLLKLPRSYCQVFSRRLRLPLTRNQATIQQHICKLATHRSLGLCLCVDFVDNFSSLCTSYTNGGTGYKHVYQETCMRRTASVFVSRL